MIKVDLERAGIKRTPPYGLGFERVKLVGLRALDCIHLMLKLVMDSRSVRVYMVT